MANKNSEILSAVKSAGEAALRLYEDNKSLRERLRSTQSPGLAVRQQAADAIESLTAENAALRDDHERACGLVAEMHAAAVGEVRGPTLGVVEDIAALRSRLAEAELNVAEVPTLCRRYEARLADLEAERALIVARAENAEAALVEAEAKIAELRDALGCEMDDTRNACAAVNAEIDRVNKRLAEAERNEGTLLGMIRHQRDVLRECLPYINESMAGRRPGRCADDIRAAVKALTADSGDERNG